MKKINDKGFTLIELLATIIIVGLLSTVAIVSVTKYYEKSKEKAEEAFISQLEKYVDDYISLYGSSLTYSSVGEKMNKCYIEGTSGVENCDEIRLFSSKNNLNVGMVADAITNKPFINPASEIKCEEEEVTIYRDTDFVYCFIIEPRRFNDSCIDDEINTCDKIFSDIE